MDNFEKCLLGYYEYGYFEKPHKIFSLLACCFLVLAALGFALKYNENIRKKKGY
ncbi:MAG: hypothetical protein IPK95_03720 [Cellvibrionales bacterium]|nr:hypothetical protein [Cellvibrionales bacterium]